MPVTSGVGKAGWRLFEHDEAVSTNDLARKLPAWTAVRAARQTGGRGRFGRAFVSDPGGPWISAVLPAEGGASKWIGFSLMVGLHLVRMLEALATPAARLRWPNDLLSGKKKLGGLLIEQSSKDALVVGFGLNISNAPWATDPGLAAIATSLAEAGGRAPSVEDVAVLTLDALADAHAHMEEGGMAAAIEALNPRWQDRTMVRIDRSDGSRVHGRFLGLDLSGNLRLLDDANAEFLVGHQSIEKLTEID
jgi:BirA family biotin operon repressor/biotin-[acetyl-CoA-carboxylase] ligase